MNFLSIKFRPAEARMAQAFQAKICSGWVLLLILIGLLHSSQSLAQGDMRFFGTASKDGKALPGATVTVVMDGHPFKTVTTGRNGKFKFDFDMGHQYRLSFVSPGCIDMYMLLDLRVPPEKMNLFPDYAIEVPFFESTSKTVHVDLYKDQPFAKVVYDGKNGFQDDPTYKFVEKVLVDPAEEARKQAALIAAAEQKAKEEADKKAHEAAMAEEERKAKAQAEQKKLEDAVARAKDEESRKKAEEALEAQKRETMESEAMRLEKEKQEKALLEKKNRGIKNQYENELLKMVAESEKKANLQKYNNMKNESEAGSVIQTMRRTAELNAATEALRRQEKQKEERTLVNKQLKVTQVKRLVEAAALTEKIIRISESPVRDPSTYSHESVPNVVVSVTEGILSDIRTTLITKGDFRVTYKKESYIWGSSYYYRNGVEMDEKTYTAELAKYLKK
jgi:hypothetical protein